MTFDIYSVSTGWVDLMQYLEYHGIDGSRSDVDGPNSGQVIAGAQFYRDKLASKYKWNFTTIPLNNAEARLIESVLAQEYFRVRTDYFTVSVTQYEAFCKNATKTYVMYKGYDRVKLSFSIDQR